MGWMMGLQNRLRRENRQAARHGIDVQAAVDTGLPPAHKMEVSQETLELLRKGHASLVQRRQQVAQQLQEVDAAIQRQVGGIQVLEGLLAGEGNPQPSAP